MCRRISIALATLLILSSPAFAQYIGIFMDAQATSCAGDVGPAPWIDLHVVAILEGAVTEMTGAQFKITGAPAAWSPESVLWVPEPNSAISIGNPVFPTASHPGTAGVNVAFRFCQSGPEGGRVHLGRVVILGAPTPGNVHLRVEGFELVRSDPASPLLVGCAPEYWKLGVGGGEIVLNGPQPASCNVAVLPSTWTSVKLLYD